MKEGHDMVMEVVSSYRDKLNGYAKMNFLELWYTKFTMDDLRGLSDSTSGPAHFNIEHWMFGVGYSIRHSKISFLPNELQNSTLDVQYSLPVRQAGIFKLFKTNPIITSHA